MAASGFTFEVNVATNAVPANIARPDLPDLSGTRFPETGSATSIGAGLDGEPLRAH
jgi:hypothetical protein